MDTSRPQAIQSTKFSHRIKGRTKVISSAQLVQGVGVIHPRTKLSYLGMHRFPRWWWWFDWSVMNIVWTTPAMAYFYFAPLIKLAFRTFAQAPKLGCLIPNKVKGSVHLMAGMSEASESEKIKKTHQNKTKKRFESICSLCPYWLHFSYVVTFHYFPFFFIRLRLVK